MPILWQGQVWHRVNKGGPKLERLDIPHSRYEEIPFTSQMALDVFVNDLKASGEATEISYSEVLHS